MQSSVAQHLQKYEDFLVDAPQFGCRRHLAAWAVFDGHGGDRVSHFLSCQLVHELEQWLPDTAFPTDASEHAALYTDQVRKAITATFLSLTLQVQQQHCSSSAHSSTLGCGSTATVVVQTGPLLTVANVGNSKCVLDIGHTAFECTSDHGLGDSELEEERLDAAGAHVARLRFDLSGPASPDEVGCGPLRLWPGGLSMSRAIGDQHCNSLVIPHPNIMQLWLPKRASRLIMASATVWDCFETYHKAASVLRDVSLQNAAPALLRRAVQRRQHLQERGDMSVVVVDFVPQQGTGFRSQMRVDRLSCNSTSSNHSASSAIGPVTAFLCCSKAPAKLSTVGMVSQGSLQQQLLQQQHSQQLQSQNSNSFRRHFCTGAYGDSPPLLSSFNANACSSVAGHCGLQQQQQQEDAEQPPSSAGSWLQGLRSVFCFAPTEIQAAQSMAQGHNGGSSSSSSNRSPNSSGIVRQTSSFELPFAVTANVQRSSSMNSYKSSSSNPNNGSSSSRWHLKRWCRTPGTQLMHKSQEEWYVARIITKLDSFQAYFGGQYQALEKQLAMLESPDAAGRVIRTVRSLNDLSMFGDSERPRIAKCGRSSLTASNSDLSSSGTAISMPLSV